MKKIVRLFLAIFSTLLLAAGFSRAAERIDPLTAATSHDTVIDQKANDGCLPCMGCDIDTI